MKYVLVSGGEFFFFPFGWRSGVQCDGVEVRGTVVTERKPSRSDSGKYRCDQWYRKGRDRYEKNSFNIRPNNTFLCVRV